MKALRHACCVIALSACFARTELPPGAQISCVSDADCPPLYICRSGVQRCYNTEGDNQPPALVNGEVVLDKKKLSTGQTVTMRFASTKPLGSAPTLEIFWRGAAPEDRVAQLVSEEPDARYVFSYTSTGGESEGEASLRITLVDELGNIGLEDLPRMLEFDRTPPVVVSGTEAMEFEPGANNVLSHISRVGEGSIVRFSFAVSEALAQDPIVTARAVSDATQVIALVRESALGTSYNYSLSLLDAAHPQGEYDIDVEAIDQAGNASLSSLATELIVDTMAPAALDADTPGLMVYSREPWGSAIAPAQVRMKLEIAPSTSLEPGATIIVYSAPQPPRAELGRGVTNVDGSLSLALADEDHSAIFAVQVDGAGNASPAVQVRETLWTASFGGKIAGSEAENPHRFEQRNRFTAALEVRRGGWAGSPEASGGASAAMDGSHVRTLGTLGWWRDRGARMAPLENGRTRLAFASDPLRGRIMGLGGHMQGNLFRQPTRVNFWEGEVFVTATAGGAGDASSPPGSAFYVAAYDPMRDRIVAYVGQSGDDNDQLWEYDGSNWFNERATAPPNGEPSVTYGALASGPQGGVLLFGGTDGGNYRNKTWLWDGNAWNLLAAAGPSGRTTAIATDLARRTTVLFGGQTGASTYAADTWRFDGTLWSPVTIDDDEGDGEPSPRAHHRLAFDTARGVFVLFGGINAGIRNNEVWELTNGNGSVPYDHASWIKRCDGVPADDDCGTAPTPRAEMGWAYDGISGQMVAAGGATGPSNVDYSEELWGFNGASWRLLVEPEPANWVSLDFVDGALAFDSEMDRLIAFGGRVNSTLYGSTYVFDGAFWVEILAGASPQARQQHAMAFDEMAKALVLFGGADLTLTTPRNDTWVMSGSPRAWQEICASCAPPARMRHTMAYDANRMVTVMYGGHDASNALSDTWEWNGAAWDQRCEGVPSEDVCGSGTDLPGPQERAALVYDELNSVLVLFTNPSSAAETDVGVYTFDGINWTRRTPSDPEGDGNPPKRNAFAASFDGQQVILHGGEEASGDMPRDVWAWNGESWRRGDIPADSEGDGSLPERRYHSMAFDSNRGRVFVHGGTDIALFTSIDAWTWEPATFERPAAVLRFDINAAALPTGTVIQSVEINAVVGASGLVDVASVWTPADGVEAFVWHLEGWRLTGSSSASAAMPELLTLSLDPDELATATVGGTLSIALAPAGRNGDGSAEVAVDYAEAILHATLPP